ncbi:MAG TPA: hypothetical protein VK789_32935 [Bryobacteraceae bacterium]|jgi:hypothetical protein|nr:hypothetical protein [Bryobacteraceae bacterium]
MWGQGFCPAAELPFGVLGAKRSEVIVNRAVFGSRQRLLSAQLPAQSASTPQDESSRPRFSHESLGTQTIEGVLAEGSRTTVTYPIGSLGNDKPITTTMESWMSPELKMVVLSKNPDPRNGDSTMRLTNISRAEPDALLFQVPPDYEIVEPHQ